MLKAPKPFEYTFYKPFNLRDEVLCRKVVYEKKNNDDLIPCILW
jgi:hypothetical protein